MKRFFVFFMVLSCVSFIPISYAEECDSKYLKEVANAVNVDSEFDYEAVEMGLPSENLVTVYGLTNEIYAITDDRSVGFYHEDMVEGAVVKVVDNSEIKKLEIYSTKCPEMRLRTIDLTLKSYNSYSNYDECIGLEDKVDVCSKFYDGKLDYEEFLKKINKYKNENKVTTIVDESVDTVFDFLKEHVIVIVIAIVTVVMGVVFVVYRFKKNRLD